MREKLYIVLLMGIVALAAAGCVYDYEPEDDEIQGLDKPLVVIDGDIIVGGITCVKVGLTQSLTVDEETVPLGASVWVESETGEVLSGRVLEEKINEFEINTEDLSLQGRYRLGVSIPGRGEYLSEYKSVLVSPPIDSITFSIADDRSYARIEVTTHNADKDNFLYCRWKYSENWESGPVYKPLLEYLVKEDFMYEYSTVEQDEKAMCYSEGNSKEVLVANTSALSENVIFKKILKGIPNTDTRVSGLYCISVEQTVLDAKGYMYWEAMQKNSGETGGLFAPQPSEVRGNIECVTSPGEIVLGYVNVSTRRTLSRFIDWKNVRLFVTDCYWKGIGHYDLTENGDVINLWQKAYAGKLRPVTYQDWVYKSYPYWAPQKCVDCASYSNSTKPDFWPR